MLVAGWLLGCSDTSTVEVDAAGPRILLEVRVVPSEAARDVQRTKRALERRFDVAGFHRVRVHQTGPAQLEVVLPAIREDLVEVVRRILTRQGQLEFRVVHPQSDQVVSNRPPIAGHEYLPASPWWRGPARPPVCLVSGRPAEDLAAQNLRLVTVIKHPVTRQPVVEVELDRPGTKAFARVTQAQLEQRLAMVVDGEVVCAPVIKEAVTQGRFWLQADFSEVEALQMAAALRHPLPRPIRIVAAPGL